MSEVSVDGRRAKGERARKALIEATLSIIEREGIAGVTHRTVTREAGTAGDIGGIPLRHDQRSPRAVAAVCRSGSLPRPWPAARADADPIGAFAHWLVADFTKERSRVIAEYELFLYAARVPR